jgi:hypothetical protein
MTKIYCFINGYVTNGLLEVVALSEDGRIVAWHPSKNEEFAKRDIGINSLLKHRVYKNIYPQGYKLIWLDEPFNDERVKAAAKIYEEVK